MTRKLEPGDLVAATHNKGKVKELKDLFEPLGFKVVSAIDLNLDEPEETEKTFTGNAILKARAAALATGRPALSDDSGLAVNALDGAPGIYSARFAGENATDGDNNRYLLTELGSTAWERRTAHYVCHMTVADAEGQIRAESEAKCHGRIRTEPDGNGGFGYDPLFEVIEYHRTFGQLGDTVKSVLSHRSRALSLLLPQLLQLQRRGAWK